MTAPQLPQPPKRAKRPRRQCGEGAGTDNRCPAWAAKGRRWCRPHCEEKSVVTQERLDKQEAKLKAQIAKLRQRGDELRASHRARYPELYTDE